MNQITAAEFKRAVELDPAWASKLTEPVEITDYCDMRRSGITHHSHLLTFSGRSKHGDVANFSGCESLKVAEGTFHGAVVFAYSGIEKIGNLNITQPSNNGNAARFRGCQLLKVAEGTFPGYASFSNSSIEKIGNLDITQPDNGGNAADFYGCKSLKVAEGTFHGFVSFKKSGIEKIGDLKITQPNSNGGAADFYRCEPLKVAEGTFPGFVSFAYSGLEKIGDLNITQPNKYGRAADFEECGKLTELSGNFPGTVAPPPKTRLAHNFKATDFQDPFKDEKAGWEPLLKQWPPNPNSTKSLNEILGILKNLPEKTGDIELGTIKQIIKNEITQKLEILKKIMSKQEQSIEIDLE